MGFNVEEDPSCSLSVVKLGDTKSITYSVHISQNLNYYLELLDH